MDIIMWGALAVIVVVGVILWLNRNREDQLVRNAKNGDVEAQFTLAQQYYDGEGREQDRKLAAQWCETAARADHPDAQAMLAHMYEYGAGGLPKQREVAVQWYGKAAEQGHRVSQRMLGLAYYHGRGIPQNYYEAYCWLNVARATGVLDQEEKNIMKEIEAMLDPNQILRAQKESVQRHAETRG